MYKPRLVAEIKNYSKEKGVADLFSGLTVGVVALPLAMAFAIGSGLPPERGLFTAIVAGFLISMLGGSRVQIGGPTGAFVVLVSSVVIQFGYSGLAICTLIAGFLLVLFGVFKLGGLIKFIPFPVTTGFTTGIAVVIFSTQIKDLLGLRVGKVPAEFLGQWEVYLTNLGSVNGKALVIGLVTIAIILWVRHSWPRLPAMLIGMLVATLLTAIFHLDIETIGSRFGDLPRVLPAPSLPDFSYEQLPQLIKPAFTIAILAAIESLLSATVADGMIGDHHNPNDELVGQGIANIASVVFGGIPATGAIARTATNVKSGARTPVSGMIHAVTLTLILLLFAPYARYIPLASLAGILAVVCYNMAELHHFRSLLKGPRGDAFILVLTFALTVLIDLTVAVQVGVVLAALIFMRRMSNIVSVGAITRELHGDETVREDPNSLALRVVPEDVEVFEVNGPLFFGMIDTFNNALQAIERTPKVLIIRVRNVLVIDATAIHVLEDLHVRCQQERTLLIFSGVHPNLMQSFTKAGFVKAVGEINFWTNIDDALARARDFLEKENPSTSH